MEFTVKDILKRSHFQETEILTGKNGLNRTVTWAHVIEIGTFGHLLNGQELILTTGIDWKNDEEKSLHYLQQLLDHNVSALCIELWNPKERLSEEMLNLAEQHDFPIIIFNEEVKFIDITKDIHEALLGYQNNAWHDLEVLNEKLNENLVSNASIDELLKTLYQATNKQVALIYKNKESWFFPAQSDELQSAWINKVEQEVTSNFYSYPIYLLNDAIATLYFTKASSKDISSFDQHAIKRCSEFLSQYFWKYHQQIEAKRIKENEWILEALNGALTKDKITINIQNQNSTIKINEAIIGVIPDIDNPHSDKDNEIFLTGILLSLNTIFENEGFYLLTSRDKKQKCYTFLLLNQSKREDLYKRLTDCLTKIKGLNLDRVVTENLRWLSFGIVVSDYKNLSRGYQTALSTLNYQINIETLHQPFYNNLTIHRLVEQFENTHEINDIIEDYIGPLIAYDQEKGTELLETLRVYLKNLAVKNKTASDLYIVRQTLYHRLDRIKQLIGTDYKEPKKRIMIEFALYALDYLEKTGYKSIK